MSHCYCTGVAHCTCGSSNRYLASLYACHSTIRVYSSNTLIAAAPYYFCRSVGRGKRCGQRNRLSFFYRSLFIDRDGSCFFFHLSHSDAVNIKLTSGIERIIVPCSSEQQIHIIDSLGCIVSKAMLYLHPFAVGQCSLLAGIKLRCTNTILHTLGNDLSPEVYSHTLEPGTYRILRTVFQFAGIQHIVNIASIIAS